MTKDVETAASKFEGLGISALLPAFVCAVLHKYIIREEVTVNILVREYRCSGGTDTANPATRNRCSGTGIPHLVDCYLRVYSLKARFNPYTSRIER